MFANRNAPIAARLKRQMRRLELSVRDVAAWLDRPYGSVYQWVRGQVPRSPIYEDVVKRLRLLEDRTVASFEVVFPLKGEARQQEIKKVHRRARRARSSVIRPT